MANIKVHVLNFHGITSHIQIILENISETPTTYYCIDRARGAPEDKFSHEASELAARYKRYLKQADEIVDFIIDADPAAIIQSWKEYYKAASAQEAFYCQYVDPVAAAFVGLLTNNCADTVEWFLKRFAHIPKTSCLDNRPLKMDHVVFGLRVPSCFPIGVTLPDKVMDNVKTYVESKESKPSLRGLFTNRNAALALGLAASSAIYQYRS
jgi:hypothetical protein